MTDGPMDRDPDWCDECHCPAGIGDCDGCSRKLAFRRAAAWASASGRPWVPAAIEPEYRGRIVVNVACPACLPDRAIDAIAIVPMARRICHPIPECVSVELYVGRCPRCSAWLLG
jgi:hypothetical protein